MMKSMNRESKTRWVFLAAGLLCLAAAPGVTAQEVAIVSVAGGSVSWLPQVTADSFVLTVSGGGVVLRREFQGQPLFAPVDEEGDLLPDGNYTWELLAIPGSSDLSGASITDGRASADGSTVRQARSPRGLSQSGSFTILNGALVDPNLQEAEPVRVARGGGLQVAGDLRASGIKNFAVIDPGDSDRAIYYAALEGPEAGTYYRGNARTASGEAVIELPEHFAKVTETEGMTVQLTPLGGWSRLYVAEYSPQRLVVRDAEGGDVEFSFLVQGVRKGYADYQVERPADGIDR